MYQLNPFTTILTLVFPLLVLSSPYKRAGYTHPEFNITSLAGTFPHPGTYGTGPIDSSLSITISYSKFSSSSSSSPLNNTTCSYAWPAGTPPGPTPWTPCRDAALQWRLPKAGWAGIENFRVDVYQASLTADNTAGLFATHSLTANPGVQNDPDAFMSCLQMGKFNPQSCELNGPLSVQRGPVVMRASMGSRPEK